MMMHLCRDIHTPCTHKSVLWRGNQNMKDISYSSSKKIESLLVHSKNFAVISVPFLVALENREEDTKEDEEQ